MWHLVVMYFRSSPEGSSVFVFFQDVDTLQDTGLYNVSIFRLCGDPHDY